MVTKVLFGAEALPREIIQRVICGEHFALGAISPAKHSDKSIWSFVKMFTRIGIGGYGAWREIVTAKIFLIARSVPRYPSRVGFEVVEELNHSTGYIGSFVHLYK